MAQNPALRTKLPQTFVAQVAVLSSGPRVTWSSTVVICDAVGKSVSGEGDPSGERKFHPPPVPPQSDAPKKRHVTSGEVSPL